MLFEKRHRHLLPVMPYTSHPQATQSILPHVEAAADICRVRILVFPPCICLFFWNRFCWSVKYNILQILPSEPLTVVYEKRYFGQSWCRLELLLLSSWHMFHRDSITCYKSSILSLQSRTSLSQPPSSDADSGSIAGSNGWARSKNRCCLKLKSACFGQTSNLVAGTSLLGKLGWTLDCCDDGGSSSRIRGPPYGVGDRRAWGAESRIPRGKELARWELTTRKHSRRDSNCMPCGPDYGPYQRGLTWI
jgi:hypothetical protein